jgi:hypothetical protein
MKRLLAATIAAFVFGGLSAPAALAAGKADTRVTLDHIEISPYAAIWTGDIFSPKKACKNERRVIVYRVRNGQDEKRGSTLSYKGSHQPGYYWGYSEDATIPPAGNYYAKVLPTKGCNGDRSGLYRLTL